jgi:hypothetical protein
MSDPEQTTKKPVVPGSFGGFAPQGTGVHAVPGMNAFGVKTSLAEQSSKKPVAPGGFGFAPQGKGFAVGSGTNAFGVKTASEAPTASSGNPFSGQISDPDGAANAAPRHSATPNPTATGLAFSSAGGFGAKPLAAAKAATPTPTTGTTSFAKPQAPPSSGAFANTSVAGGAGFGNPSTGAFASSATSGAFAKSAATPPIVAGFGAPAFGGSQSVSPTSLWSAASPLPPTGSKATTAAPSASAKATDTSSKPQVVGMAPKAARHTKPYVESLRLVNVSVGHNAFLSLPFTTTRDAAQEKSASEKRASDEADGRRPAPLDRHFSAVSSFVVSESGDTLAVELNRPSIVLDHIDGMPLAPQASAHSGLYAVGTERAGGTTVAVLSASGTRHSVIDVVKGRAFHVSHTRPALGAFLHPEKPGLLVTLQTSGIVQLSEAALDDGEFASPVAVERRTFVPQRPSDEPDVDAKSRTGAVRRPAPFVAIAAVDATVSLPVVLAFFVDRSGSVFAAPMGVEELDAVKEPATSPALLRTIEVISSKRFPAHGHAAVALEVVVVDGRAGTFGILVAFDNAEIRYYVVSERFLARALYADDGDSPRLSSSGDLPPSPAASTVSPGGSAASADGHAVAKEFEDPSGMSQTPRVVPAPTQVAGVKAEGPSDAAAPFLPVLVASIDVCPRSGADYVVSLARGRDASRNFFVVTVVPLARDEPTTPAPTESTGAGPKDADVKNQDAGPTEPTKYSRPVVQQRRHFLVCVPVWSTEVHAWVYSNGPSFHGAEVAGASNAPAAPLALPLPPVRGGVVYQRPSDSELSLPVDKTPMRVDTDRTVELGLDVAAPVLGADCLAFIETNGKPADSPSNEASTRSLFLPLRYVIQSAKLARLGDRYKFASPFHALPDAAVRSAVSLTSQMHLAALHQAHHQVCERLLLETYKPAKPANVQSLFAEAEAAFERLHAVVVDARKPQREREDVVERRVLALRERVDALEVATMRAVVQAETARVNEAGVAGLYALNERLGELSRELTSLENPVTTARVSLTLSPALHGAP